MSSGRFLGGLVLGGMLGAVLALLTTPKSGPEARSWLANELGNHTDGLGDERELLNRGNDDGHAVSQSLCQLLCVLVDLLNHPKFVLELEDRVLQLLIEHAPVGDDDY